MNDNVKTFGFPLETCAPLKRDFNLKNEDQENILYHAREGAQPFTYGGLSEELSRSQLNHVEGIFDGPVVENVKEQFLKPSVKDIKENFNKGTNTSTQKGKHLLLTKSKLHNDLVQHSKLTGNLFENMNNQIVLGENEIADDLQICNNELINIFDNGLNLNKGHSKDQHVPGANDLNRCQTPSFPLEESRCFSRRSSSPYPTLNPQTCSHSVKIKNERKIITKNITAQQIDTNFVKFAKDTSKFWYKPHISREEALILLRNAKPGSFIIRNSTTYANSFGLVLRVSRLPEHLVATNDHDELVRHYLLEPTDCGVRLKGYHNEPIFTSLSAFVYQHAIDKLAFPCKLIIPKKDLSLSFGQADLSLAQEQLLAQGAACNVLYLFNYNTESLTGDEAIRKASNVMFLQFNHLKPIEVHFKVSNCGVTLTDNKRLFFFRRHYSVQNISYFGPEPDNRMWKISNKEKDYEKVLKTIFAFIARPLTGGKDNQCHVFCDLSVKQPASAIISFTQKVLPLAVRGRKII